MKNSRRNFLKGLGAASLLPLLPSLFPENRAFADEPRAPTRLIIFFGLNGMIDPAFWPSELPTNQVAPKVYATDLASINGPISRVSGPEWDALRSKISIVRGLGQ